MSLCSLQIRQNPLKIPLGKSRDYYTISQKTSLLQLAITLTHVNGFWYFLAECYW